MEKNWVKIRAFNKIYLGEIAKEVLLDNGINAVVINKQASTHLDFGDVEIYVAKENALKAINYLKELN